MSYPHYSEIKFSRFRHICNLKGRQTIKSWCKTDYLQSELERSRHNLHAAETTLRARRENYKKKDAVLREQYEDIIVDAKSFRENVKMFNKFIVSNDEKRQRMRGTITYNQCLVREYEKNIADLREKITQMKEQKSDLDNEITGHLTYKNFLEAFVSEFGKLENFRSPEQVIKRYKHLKIVDSELSAQRSDVVQKFRKCHQDFVEYQNRSRDLLINLHTRAYMFLENHKKAIRNTDFWERQVSDIRRKIIQTYADINTTKDVIWNLYLMTCKTRRIDPKVKKHNLKKQLVMINRAMRLFKKVHRRAKPFLQKCTTSLIKKTLK